MHLLSSIVLQALFLAAPVLAGSYVEHERRTEHLPERRDSQRIEPNALLPMRIALMHNEDAQRSAAEWLMDVSHPDSNKYGRFWTASQVIDAFKPSDETIRNVTSWLSDHGISDFEHSDNKLSIAFDVEAIKAEEMLRTTFYEHVTDRGDFHASCDLYHLPAHLVSHIHYVTPGVLSSSVTGRTIRSRESLLQNRDAAIHTTTSTATSRTQTTSTTSPSHQPSALPYQKLPPHYNLSSLNECDEFVTPACIRAMYNFTVPDPKLPVSANNTLGILEAEGDFYTQAFLNNFYKYVSPDIPRDTSPIFHPIDGNLYPPTQKNGSFKHSYILGPESNLDVEVALPIIYPQNVSILQVETHDDSSFFNAMLDAIDGSYCTKADRKAGRQCGTLKPNNVISMSYYVYELASPDSYYHRMCNEFLKLGLQGVSVLSITADNGAITPLDGFPEFNCTNKAFTRVLASPWPGACPWVTSVGGTQIAPGKSYRDIEAWPSSSGGFSLLDDAPSYQKAALASYFKNHDPGFPYFTNGNYNDTKGRYNRNGRGSPDISAIAFNVTWDYGVVNNGGGGTSAATPISASLFNRIIEERIRVGKGPLGFLNPVLYKNADAFNDVVTGNNSPCPGQADGFNAVPGWDPVTGLGTPNYGKLLDVFMKLP